MYTKPPKCRHDNDPTTCPYCHPLSPEAMVVAVALKARLVKATEKYVNQPNTKLLHQRLRQELKAVLSEFMAEHRLGPTFGDNFIDGIISQELDRTKPS